MAKKICIIGSGAAGILSLLNLKSKGVSPSQIIIIDPFHDGGDIMRRWANVKSNTIWKQILDSVPPQTSLPEPWASLDPHKPCELHYIGSYLLWSSRDFYWKCDVHTGLVHEIIYATDENPKHTIYLQNSKTPISADILIIATGSEPKTMDLPFPTIPLHIALDKTQLVQRVKPGQHILVFGTAHSSTLIVDSLANLGAIVTNFYITDKPFYFDRDGDYDGLKQDAATIADKIMAGEYPNVELVHCHNTPLLIRKTRNADAVIYATGFQPRDFKGFKQHDGLSGRLLDTKNAWAFGIAFPNRAPDGVHWDVSVPAFQQHIQKQIPDILSLLDIE